MNDMTLVASTLLLMRYLADHEDNDEETVKLAPATRRQLEQAIEAMSRIEREFS